MKILKIIYLKHLPKALSFFLFFPIPDKSRVSLKYLQYWNEGGTDTTECNLELKGKFFTAGRSEVLFPKN